MTRDPANDAPILVMAAHGRLVGLDRRTGQTAWTVVLTEEVDRYYGGFAVELLMTASRVYAAGWKSDEIVCVEYPTGREIGRAKLTLAGEGRVAMIVDGGQLFAARDGQVACFTLDGQPVWSSERVFDKSLLPTALGFPGNVRQADDRFQK